MAKYPLSPDVFLGCKWLYSGGLGAKYSPLSRWATIPPNQVRQLPHYARGRQKPWLWLVAGVMVMQIIRHLVAGTDWLNLIVECAVLAVILWLELPEWLHRRKAAKFASALAPLIARGQQVADVVPSAGSPTDEWTAKATAWTAVTREFLAERSPRALSSFDFVATAKVDRKMSGRAGDVYQEFHARLQNLIRIAERPEHFI